MRKTYVTSSASHSARAICTHQTLMSRARYGSWDLAIVVLFVGIHVPAGDIRTGFARLSLSLSALWPYGIPGSRSKLSGSSGQGIAADTAVSLVKLAVA
ncbi:hypothetical protein ACFZA9_06415 [Streptomyces olivaceus]|uniref:hypothetical protein n=1 Tax=Streptomyces olivaceus TaxID=47716 RepID=UPI0036E55C8D